MYDGVSFDPCFADTFEYTVVLLPRIIHTVHFDPHFFYTSEYIMAPQRIPATVLVVSS